MAQEETARFCRMQPHSWEMESDSPPRAWYAKRVYALAYSMMKHASYAPLAWTMAAPAAENRFSALGEEMTFAAAGFFLVWTRLARDETFMHIGSGSGRLSWYAYIATGARCRAVETEKTRATLLASLQKHVVSELWRWPELREGVDLLWVHSHYERILLGASRDVILLSDYWATAAQQRVVDELLAQAEFRLVVSYQAPARWASLRPHREIEPNSVELEHDGLSAPRRLFLYQKADLMRPPRPVARPRASSLYRPWTGDTDPSSSEDWM